MDFFVEQIKPPFDGTATLDQIDMGEKNLDGVLDLVDNAGGKFPKGDKLYRLEHLRL
jgi:hypothetical protein